MGDHFFFLLQSYFFNVDSFNFNYAQAKAATGCYQEAEEVFLLINSEKYKTDYVYISWLARCCELLASAITIMGREVASYPDPPFNFAHGGPDSSLWTNMGVAMEMPPFTMTSFQSAHGQVAVWCKYSE